MTKERYIEILEIALDLFKRTDGSKMGHTVFVRDKPVFRARAIDEDVFTSPVEMYTSVTFLPSGPVITRS